MSVFLQKLFTILFLFFLTSPSWTRSHTSILSLNKIIRDPLQSKDGYIWVATTDNVWRYDGYELLSIDQIYKLPESLELTQIRSMTEDQNGNLWIGTKENGIFLIDSNKIHQVHSQDLSHMAHHKLIAQGEWLWSVTEEGLIKFNQNEFYKYPFGHSNSIKSDGYIVDLKADGDDVYILKTNQLIIFSKTSKQYSTSSNTPPVKLKSFQAQKPFHLATDTGVFKSDDLTEWHPIYPLLKNTQIKTTLRHDKYDWITTIYDGVFRIDLITNETKQYHEKGGQTNKLSSKFATNLMVDDSGLIWVFHFNGSIDTINLKQESFGYNKLSNNPSCNLSESYYGVTENDQFIWITSQSGVHKINKTSQQCSTLTKDDNGQNVFKNNVPVSIFYDDQMGVLIGTSKGLFTVDENSQIIPINTTVKLINFIKPLSKTKNLVGTVNGLFLFDKVDSSLLQVGQSEGLEFFGGYFDVNFNQYYLATNKGIFTLKDNTLSARNDINSKLPTLFTQTIIRHQNFLYIGTLGNGLFKIDLENLNSNQNAESILSNKFTINGSLLDSSGIWFLSKSGLFYKSFNTDELSHYTEINGLQSNSFNNNSIFILQNKNIFAGGIKGYNYFNPSSIKVNKLPPKINITKLKLFNNPVLIGDTDSDFKLTDDINSLDELVLSHNDYIASFEFAAMDFTASDSNKYRYKLHPFEKEWNETTASQRVATYTNLPSGNFELMIYGSNNDGVWNTEPKILKIKVLPPPWLTWWALSSYVLIFMYAVYWYVQRKIKTNKLIAERLKIEVTEKTKELNTQKQTVESLLFKKNELFSNVSHEFRTPLTLILGPIKELLAKQVDTDDIKNLKMINRSANRLLSLVEQLLQIARVSDLDKVKTTPQNTQKQVESLVDSFQHMAKSKRITLSLETNDSAAIDVTDQFIDAVLGNLVSNAIKYTPSGGSVWVTASKTNDSLILSVKDTGAGLTREQQNDIFKRFKRLDSHQAIEGIGIGLSVVEEVVKVNHGKIAVKSTIGKGSEFIVKVPLSDVLDADEQAHISSLVSQLQNESIESSQQSLTPVSGQLVEDIELNTVLIIEDNHDMREHIISIVSPHYNCLSAENGVKGVATAIEQVPDIIISDVMMPEMDGFKVARIIRSDQRTSHIPLMLLTALNDKTSRIKGWRENVDAYMTKPFDRDELLIQLENMLTIRDILKKKAGQSINDGKQNSVLPKKDQAFIDQLMDVIENNYQDPMLSRSKIAGMMAVSDRQLQRKLKALIDQNPMDILREYRLNKSKEQLKDGYQVSIIADNCGFNSISYFSQCFKAQFGMSPKQYQKK